MTSLNIMRNLKESLISLMQPKMSLKRWLIMRLLLLKNLRFKSRKSSMPSRRALKSDRNWLRSKSNSFKLRLSILTKIKRSLPLKDRSIISNKAHFNHFQLRLVFQRIRKRSLIKFYLNPKMTLRKRLTQKSM